ncbi:MAG: hypothetical protein IT495_20065 [Gammaproteobacteria bacterium]|nr:hypothetical protein [Gammaproteobacteria bacterium]
MGITRRGILKGTTGAAVLLSTPLAALALEARTGTPPLLVVHGDDAPSRAFAAHLAGGNSIRRELVLSGWQGEALADLRALLAAHRGHCLLGMVGNDVYPVFEELVRDGGGAILCRGQHVSDASGTRHLFYSMPGSRGIGSALGSALAASDAGLHVREIALGGSQASRPAGAGVPPGGDWIAATAALYRRIAEGRYTPGPAATVTRGGGADARGSARLSVETFAIRL